MVKRNTEYLLFICRSPQYSTVVQHGVGLYLNKLHAHAPRINCNVLYCNVALQHAVHLKSAQSVQIGMVDGLCFSVSLEDGIGTADETRMNVLRVGGEKGY